MREAFVGVCKHITMTYTNDDTKPLRPVQVTAEPNAAPVPPPYDDDTDTTPPQDSAGCLMFGVIGAGIVLLGLAIVLLAAAAGWTEGQRTAMANAAATNTADLNRQLDLFNNDLAQGNLDMANIRLQYLATQTPGIPQVAALAQTATAAFINSQPTATPTPTPTATDDPASQITPTSEILPTIDPNAEQSAALAQRLERAKEAVSLATWPEAIEELDIIISTDPNFERATVRNLMSQALNSQARRLYQTGSLGEAIFYTDWAEEFGVLAEGLNYERYIANLYLTAKAAIGTTNTQTALTNLREIYNINPNYMNGEVGRLLAQSYAGYGDALLMSAPCDAVGQYNAALNLFNDSTWLAKRNTAQNYCEFGTPTPEGFVATPEGQAPPEGGGFGQP